MSIIRLNGFDLYHQSDGDGSPLVLVHGNWSDHGNWQAVAPALAESFRTVTYDRRGHSRSDRPSDQGSRRDQEDDLAALIEALDCAPAHVVGTSFGGSIAIGLATRRPELFHSLTVHEPPLMSLVADDPEFEPLVREVEAAVKSVLTRLAEGDTEGGARQFVEQVALGPGGWEQLPEPLRKTMIETAPAFAAEQRDPEWASVDVAELARIECPVLLTQGDQSPPWFPAIVAKLAEAMAGAEVGTYEGAGHAPHLTHPDEYVAIVGEFTRRSAERPHRESITRRRTDRATAGERSAA